MAYTDEMVRQGNWLFRYRGQIPVLIFLLAIPVVLLSANEIPLWLVVCAVVISFIGALMRAYVVGTTPRGTSGRNTKEQVASVLNSTGAYSVVRHPLYLANFLMWIGIVAFTGCVWFVVTVTLAYWLYYERIMVAEENFLIGKFGQSYNDWADRTPPFIPKMHGFKSASESFSIKQVFMREYSGWLATVVGFAFVGWLEIVRDTNYDFATASADFWNQWRWVLLVSLGITLTLRTAKKLSK